MSDRHERPRRFYPSSDPLPRLTEYQKAKIPPPQPKNKVKTTTTTLESQLRFHEKLDTVTQPIILDEKRRQQTAVVTNVDSEYEWFKKVFSEWHPQPDNAQSSARHDEAFLKWYNNVVVSELQRIAHRHQLTMDLADLRRPPHHSLPVITEASGDSDTDTDTNVESQ